jgi:hypothetical protein
MVFFKKKTQKTFALWRALLESPRQRTKSFLGLFFKKDHLPSLAEAARPSPSSAIAHE